MKRKTLFFQKRNKKQGLVPPVNGELKASYLHRSQLVGSMQRKQHFIYLKPIMGQVSSELFGLATGWQPTSY